jgi:glyoxylase-like metal-dependent hydrolase (beta-lactamase superfamily II)
MRIHVLEIKFDKGGYEDSLFPVILRDDSNLILVDCGYAGFMPLLEGAFNNLGLSLKHLTGIIITHHDIDHMGALHQIKSSYPYIKVYSSLLEEKYISGKAKSLRLIQAEDVFPCLPEDQKPGALYFQEMLRAMPPVDVDVVFEEDEEPVYWKDIRIVNTPGHMPGHISIYLKDTKTLISSDAVVVESGELEIANPQYTLDLPKAIDSVKKLRQLDVTKMICYHGGIVEGDVMEKLDRLIARYS